MTLRQFFIALITFTVFSSAIFADTGRTYDIEAIVFSHFTPETLNSQQWTPLTAPPLTTSYTPDKTAKALQPELSALNQNPHYQVLWSGRWKQTWLQNGTISLPISNGKNMQGTLTIALGHYFNINANLVMTQSTRLLSGLSNNDYFKQFSGDTFTFALNQDRRMKSDELNYLGTPVFGILIKVLKVNAQN